VDELQQAFQDSVEDYLAFYAQRGEALEKPFLGNLFIRLPTELQRRAYVKAKMADKSPKSRVTEVLETAVQEQG